MSSRLAQLEAYRSWPVAVVATIIGNACPIVQPLLVGVYVDALGVELANAGYISATELAGLAIAALMVARFVGSVSLRKAGTIACSLFVMANVLSLLAGGAFPMALCRLVAGCASGAALAIGGAMAARTTQPDRVFALAFAGVTAYGTVFFMTVPAMMHSHGYPVLFVAQILLGCIATACVAFLYHPGSTLKQAAGSVAATSAPKRSLDTVRILLCGFALYVGHAAIWTYEERMGTRLGMAPADIGNALSLASIAGLIGALIAAGIGTRMGRALPQIVALTLSVIAALLIVSSANALSYAFAACLIALSWFYGLPYLAGLASALDLTGRRAAELQAVMNIGYALGPMVAATLVTATFSSIGWLAASCYALCLLLVVGPARRHDRQAGR